MTGEFGGCWLHTFLALFNFVLKLLHCHLLESSPEYIFRHLRLPFEKLVQIQTGAHKKVVMLKFNESSLGFGLCLDRNRICPLEQIRFQVLKMLALDVVHGDCLLSPVIIEVFIDVLLLEQLEILHFAKVGYCLFFARSFLTKNPKSPLSMGLIRHHLTILSHVVSSPTIPPLTSPGALQ